MNNKNNNDIKLSNKKYYTPDFNEMKRLGYKNRKVKRDLKKIMTKRNRLRLKKEEE